MATSDISNEAILKATGEPWKRWLEVFALMDAKSLPHKDIARKLHEDFKVPSWWSQMLTVKFEQEIGRRTSGDSKDGVSVSCSMTVPGSLDLLYAKWHERLAEKDTYNAVAIAQEPSLSQTPQWRYWKLKLEDGGKVSVNFSEKAGDKVLIQLTHERLADEAAAQNWKAYWQQILKEIFL